MLLSAISRLLGILIPLLLRCSILLVWIVVTLLLGGRVRRSAPIWIIALVIMTLSRGAISLLRVLLIGIMRRRWVRALSLRIGTSALAILLVLLLWLAVALALGRVVIVIATAVALLLLLAIAMALVLAVAAVVVVV